MITADWRADGSPCGSDVARQILMPQLCWSLFEWSAVYWGKVEDIQCLVYLSVASSKSLQTSIDEFRSTLYN